MRILAICLLGVVLASSHLNAQTVDIVGGMDKTASPNPWNAKGNAFRVDQGVALLQEEFYLNFTGPKAINFYVFDSPREFGTYSLVHVNSVSVVGEGNAWYSSGPIGVPLSAGRYYITAFSAPDAFAYYFNTGDSQAVSFGADVHGYASGVHPLGATISSTVNDQAIFYERLTTSPVPEPSTLVLLGVGAIALLAHAWRRRKEIGA